MRPSRRRLGRQLAAELLEARTLPSFLAPINYETESNPQAVVANDFNGDGHTDLAAANADIQGSITVLLGQGNGSFQAVGNYRAGIYPFSLAVGDLNGDKIPDLIAANGGSSENLSAFLGNGNGTFQNALTSPQVGPRLAGIAVGYFDDDGKLDVAVTSYQYTGAGCEPCNNRVYVLRGNGDGTFQSNPLFFDVGNNPRAVAVADFNADGALDLAVTYLGGNFSEEGKVNILLGNGDGTFQAAASYLADRTPLDVAVADLNGDGALDLTVANYAGGGPGTVSVLLGNGNGSFQAPRNHRVGASPQSVAVADFNGDGAWDIAAGNWSSSDVSVLLGQGDGTFRGARHTAVGVRPSAVAADDFNSDGVPDLVATLSAADGVTFLPGQGDGTFWSAPRYGTGLDPVSVAAADLNGDSWPDLVTANWTDTNAGVSVLLGNGDGTFRPTVHYPTAQGSYSVAVGDFNRDGIPDLVTATLYGSVSLLPGNGDGTFRPARNYALGGTRFFALAIGYFDGDDNLDVVVADFDGHHVKILRGNGDGTFRLAGNYATDRYPDSVAVGYVNGDTILDVVTANSGSVTVLLGNGNGSFQIGRTFAAIDGGGVALAYLNGDGHLDVVTGAAVLLGNGDGSFKPARPHGGQGNLVALSDFDRDCHLDLAVVRGWSGVRILLGNGDGTFQTTVTYNSGGLPEALVAEDFNGDGFPDVAVTNSRTAVLPPEFSDTVAILLNDADWPGRSGPGSGPSPPQGHHFPVDLATAATVALTATAGRPAAALPTAAQTPTGELLSPQAVERLDQIFAGAAVESLDGPSLRAKPSAPILAEDWWSDFRADPVL